MTPSLQAEEKKLPVVQDGRGSLLFITEEEKLFGFDSHFTDGPNVSTSKRRKLLAKSWSVQVVKNLLQPLTEYFKKS